MSSRLPDLSQAVSREKEEQKANERRGGAEVSMILLSRADDINNKNKDNDNKDNNKYNDNNNQQQG